MLKEVSYSVVFIADRTPNLGPSREPLPTGTGSHLQVHGSLGRSSAGDVRLVHVHRRLLHSRPAHYALLRVDGATAVPALQVDSHFTGTLLSQVHPSATST